MFAPNTTINAPTNTKQLFRDSDVFQIMKKWGWEIADKVNPKNGFVIFYRDSLLFGSVYLQTATYHFKEKRIDVIVPEELTPQKYRMESVLVGDSMNCKYLM